VFFVAFRSQYYNLLQTIHVRLWNSANIALTEREGHLFNGPIWFTWQTPEDVYKLLADLGLHALKLRGIGVCSGIKGDPLAHIAQPSQFSLKEQERLMKIECAVAEQYAACGRYILATAEKGMG
jgi:hypothetical protein